jgi:hypothetical protein
MSKTKNSKKNKTSSILEKIMAFWATVNLSLVLFDLTYIPLRDFWLQGRIQLFIKVGQYELELPEYPFKILPFSLTQYYDWVKGIEPYRDTEQYLRTVEKLETTINQITIEALENNPQLDNQDQQQVEAILAELRNQSRAMIETNPFQIANKSGTLERIKNKMRVHIFSTTDSSATQSFETFWSRENLRENGLRQELTFFDREIRPLIETNYYRSIGENGQLIDNFGIIDFSFFTIYFLGEFLARTWYISRTHAGLSWLDAMLWRWYDFFFFLPVFRWLRIIPVTLRLNKVGVIDLSAIKKQASQGFVAGIAEDLTEIVVIRIISQAQNLIEEGQIETILSSRNNREYININDTNETAEITKLILELIVYQVIPKIEPEVEALLTYTIEKTLTQSEAYQKLQQIPGFIQIQHNLTEQTIKQIYQIVNQTLQGILEQDQEFDQLLNQVTKKFAKTMTSEIKTKESMDQIQSLLIDLLEEIKINYVQKLSLEDVEDILEQKRALLHQAETVTPVKSLKS